MLTVSPYVFVCGFLVIAVNNQHHGSSEKEKRNVRSSDELHLTHTSSEKAPAHPARL
eukprot:m.135614 g.135614  ORF g.135614 m.135614 type:complete len:57 (+) comp13979_c4_seq1:44-214(+)